MSQSEINSQLKGFNVNGQYLKRGVGSQIFWSSFNGASLKIPIFSYTPTPGYTAPASVGLLKNSLFFEFLRLNFDHH
jgi:hypothetical protein